MPSFYPPYGPQRLPLTPPELDPVTKGVRDMTLPSQMPYVPYQTNPAPRYDHHAAYDRQDRYHVPSSAFPAPGSMMYPPPPPSTVQPPYNPMSKSGMAMPTQMYGPIQAPILPPIRAAARENPAPDATADHRSDDTIKDDKAVGGVSAHLDYKMEDMTDFVAEMAQGMYELYQSKICLADIDLARSVQPSAPVSSTFRKFVAQILSSTRLPSSTILLGLFYLSERLDKLSRQGEYATGSGQVYRLLTIGLLLGSKFLDDNTFQNRSWSEVTGLPVAELNTLEVQWLSAIDWKLHRPYEQRDVLAWRSHWDDWLGKRTARSVGNLTLSPIDQTVQRQRSQHKAISPVQPYLPSANTPSVAGNMRPLPPYQPAPQYDYNGWHPAYSHPSEHSPPSAPNTGPTTPDYLGVSGGWPSRPPPPPYTARPGPHALSQPPSYHHTPYAPAPAHSIWNGHGPTCGCVYCARPHDRYLMPPSFVPQSVVA